MYASLIVYPTTLCLLELGFDLLHCFDDADTCQVQAEAPWWILLSTLIGEMMCSSGSLDVM